MSRSYPLRESGHQFGERAYRVGPAVVRGRRPEGADRACGGGAAAEAGRPYGADGRAGGCAARRDRNRLAGSRGRGRAARRGDRAGGGESVRRRAVAGPPPGPVRAGGVRLDDPPDAGGDGRGGPDEDRSGAGSGAPRCVVAAASAARRVPVADDRREAAAPLGGDRHGRHDHHGSVEEAGRRGDLEEVVRVSSPGRVVCEHRRVSGDAAARGQRRLEHGGRPPAGAARGARPGPRSLDGEDAGAGRRRRAPPMACTSTCGI